MQGNRGFRRRVEEVKDQQLLALLNEELSALKKVRTEAQLMRGRAVTLSLSLSLSLSLLSLSLSR